MNPQLNPQEIIQQFEILHAPITADIKSLRRARNQKLHALYERSLNTSQLEECLAIDQQMATIQHAYFYIKRNFDLIHAQLQLLNMDKN